MNALVLIFIIPIICGILGFIIYRLRNEFNFLGAVLSLYYSFYLFLNIRSQHILTHNLFNINNLNFGFYLDHFNSIIILILSLVSFLILLYSFRYMRGFKHLGSYYLYFMFTIAVTNAIILSNNLLMLLIFSFLLSIILYAFLIISSQNSMTIAHQTFCISLLFNVLISLGIYLILHETNIDSIVSEPRIIVANPLITIAFLVILIGIIGKVGLFPLNFWTANLTQTPVTIFTYIPMIIEKIVGIYLLFRLAFYIFSINNLPILRIVMLAIGGLSIIIAGFMAIRTKEIYRLLNYSAVTQFGFIFLGIGCGNAIGFASAIYNAINYLTFQPSMMLSAGSIEYWTKSTQLDSLRGLASKMPFTFFALLISVLASAGIPPLNGFFARWMLFQGIIRMNGNGMNLYALLFIIILCAGCIITPIYLFKLLVSFKGKETIYSQRIRDPGFTMSFSPVFLSITSVLLGIFVNSLSMKTLISPTIDNLFSHTSLLNIWSVNLAPILLVASLIIGIIIFFVKYNPVKQRSFV